MQPCKKFTRQEAIESDTAILTKTRGSAHVMEYIVLDYMPAIPLEGFPGEWSLNNFYPLKR